MKLQKAPIANPAEFLSKDPVIEFVDLLAVK